ncbi:hypothetical protein, conserved [Leishmania tarentolae]|uniref:Uncharacterized protein n=1 Tax=Leishmania tarentolae TaxID=5689 RepID=A0A640KA91_LEITA|nr:hypothetical protein, conserved [Leishmania tarentolae]
MFFDVLDMTATYMQYITLLLKLSPDSVPSFYIAPMEVIWLLVSNINREDTEQYQNLLPLNVPRWLPLDIRGQYVLIAVIGPLALSTFGLFFVYGKPAYVWFVCLLSTLFMFLFGFIVMVNVSAFTVPGLALPSMSTLRILAGVGLPLFVLLLAVGLLGMGCMRLRQLRRDAVDLEKFIGKEQKRRESQRITQQVIDRQKIDLVTVAAEQMHSARRKDQIAHIDVGDLLWHGAFTMMLLIGSFVLLGVVEIHEIYFLQRSTVFQLLGSLTTILFIFAMVWGIMSMFKKGRQYLCSCRAVFNIHALSLLMVAASLIYINVITNFISIIYCVSTTCDAGSRMQHAASLFPPLSAATDHSDAVSSLANCVSCHFDKYTQKCPIDFQQSLCATAEKQSRLVYDTRVPCDSLDGFYKASGVLIFVFYILFLPYLQLYVTQYGFRMLQDVYPLEQRYHDVFTSEELYLQKVTFSDNSAAFAYRAYKPKYRFYRLSFLLQKIVLSVVSCVMTRGQDRRFAWIGMLFFLVVPLIALGCSVYFRPFSGPTETIFFPSLQAMVSMCSMVFLIAWSQGIAVIPLGVWIGLPVALVGVPAIALIVGTVCSLREERRRDDLLQTRLVQGVTAVYVMPSLWEQQAESSNPPQSQPGDREQPPSQQTGSPGMLEEDSDDERRRLCGAVSPPQHRTSLQNNAPASTAAAAIFTATDTRVAELPPYYNPMSNPLNRAPAAPALSPAASSSLDTVSTVCSHRSSPSPTGGITNSRRRALSRGKAMAAVGHPMDTPITASGHAFETMHNTGTCQALLAPFETHTLWDYVKALGVIAIETVAAPFLLFRGRRQWHLHRLGQGRKKNDDTVGVGGHDYDATVPTAIELGDGLQKQRPHGSMFAVASSAAANTYDDGNGTAEEAPPQCFNALPGTHTQGGTGHAKAGLEDTNVGAAGAPSNRTPALSVRFPTSLALASGPKQEQDNASSSASPFGTWRPRLSYEMLLQPAGREVGSPLPTGQARRRSVLSLDGSDGHLHELPPRQRRLSSGTSQRSDRCKGRSFDMPPTSAAGEYAREAEVEFVPSFFFVQHMRSTGGLAEAISFLQHLRWPRLGNSNATVDATGACRLSLVRHLSNSLVSILRDTQLPWQRTAGEEALSVAHRLPWQAPHSPCVSQSSPAATAPLPPPPPQQPDVHPSVSRANRAGDGMHSSGGRGAPSRLQEVLNKMCCLPRRPVRGTDAANDSTSRNNGVGAVLSFTEVYIWRKACARNATKSGLALLCTARELQKLQRESARKAFWGSPTDAMLGVADVPGSTPPWCLCKAPLPPSQQTMVSLQRQYYMQLAEQQGGADMQDRFQGAVNDRSSSHGEDRGSTAATVRYRKPGSTTDANSASVSLVCTPFSPRSSLGMPPSANPVRVAASERQAAAVRTHAHNRGIGVVPLDTVMRELNTVSSTTLHVQAGYNDDSSRLNSVAMSPEVPQVSSEADGGEGTGLAGTLHWLNEWGPLLGELLCEAAKDDETHIRRMRQRMRSRDGGKDSGSSRDSTTSSTSSGTSDDDNSSSTHASARAVPDSQNRTSPRRRESTYTNKGWIARLLSCNCVSTLKKALRWRGSEARRRQRNGSRCCDSVGGGGSRSSSSRYALSPHSVSSSIGRQPSMILSLITGNTYLQESLSETTSENSTIGNRTQDRQTAFSEITFGNRCPSSSAPAISAVKSASMGELAARTAGPSPQPRLSRKSSRKSEAQSVAPADPLVQQLRCLYLLRERLKKSHWEHCEQLTAVQRYIDHEIDEAVRRVLIFLFIVLGVVATIALALALCGMLHTLDWTFIHGTDRSNDETWYVLAGYDSWESFTQNCCCMAVTDVSGYYPYYAIDIENWVCTNGVTKERVRRDAYESMIKDGYSVRELCGMELKNNCAVLLFNGRVSVVDCNTSLVDWFARERW